MPLTFPQLPVPHPLRGFHFHFPFRPAALPSPLALPDFLFLVVAVRKNPLCVLPIMSPVYTLCMHGSIQLYLHAIIRWTERRAPIGPCRARTEPTPRGVKRLKFFVTSPCLALPGPSFASSLSACFDCLLVALPVVVVDVVGARSVGLLCVALLLGRRRGLGFCSPLAAMRSRGRPGYFSLLLLLLLPGGGGSWHSSSRRRFPLVVQLWLFYVFLWWQQHQRVLFRFG